MSILPVYLSSFSSVASLQRGIAERSGLDKADRTENTEAPEKTRRRGQEEETNRYNDGLVVRSGDVVSSYGDVFSLSHDAKSSADRSPVESAKTTSKMEEAKSDESHQSAQSAQKQEDKTEDLTDAEKQQVSELKQRDAEVKAHEAAHLGAAGGLARGGASYEYQKGPDGQNYAVGGEVSIDSSGVDGDPKATITKAQQIRSAALAPASPSSQDYKVASSASQMEAKARQELAKSEQNSQETGTIGDSQTEDGPAVEGTENTTDNQKSQFVSSSAVSKYATQSLAMTFRSPSTFRAVA